MFNTNNPKEVYLLSWFFIYGHFCKIDGNVTKKMIIELEDILSESTTEERKKCIASFNKGKEATEISEVTSFIRDLSINPKLYLSFLKILCNLSFNYRDREPSQLLQKKILSFTENTTKNTYFNSIAEGIVVSSYHSAVTRKEKTKQQNNNWQKEYQNQNNYTYEDFFKTFREKHKEYNRHYQKTSHTSSLESYFLVLGIDKNTNHIEAKKAYRKLMSQYHPDKIASLNDPVLEKKYLEKSQSIQNAYEYLKNNFYTKEKAVS